MDLKYSSNIKWANGIRNEHEIEIDIELQLQNILRSQNLEMTLHIEQNAIRKNIAELVLREAVNPMIEETGLPYITPGHLNVKAHTKHDGSAQVAIPTLPHTMLDVKTITKFQLSLKASRPVNAIQALYGHRSGLAVEIANNIMRYLNHTILKVSERSHSSNHSTKDGAFDTLNYKINESTAGDN